MKLTSVILFLTMMTLTSCYDDKDPVAEITTPTGNGYYPVSANTFVDLINTGSITTNRPYKPGVDMAFELVYWSDDPIQEINLYRTIGSGTKQKIFGAPYGEVAAFSKMKSADTLVFNYTIPQVASTTAIKLDVEIINENTLSWTRNITIQARP